MALQFRGMDPALMQEYLSRKSAGQQLSEGIQGGLNTYVQMKQQQQAQDIQKQQLASQDATRKATQFGAVAHYVPEDQIPQVAEQYGITIPTENPEGSSIIDYWDSMQGGQSQAPSGMRPTGRPTSKYGMEQYAKNLQIQKMERDLATDPNTPEDVYDKSGKKLFSVNKNDRILTPPSADGNLKAPTGYRYTTSGELEPIPGGPAAIKNARVDAKEQSLVQNSISQADLVMNKVDQALSNVSGWTAGMGSKLGSIPGTPARNLAADIDTIKANMGFNTLQEMRRNSPTGGALGNVSDRELKLLSATIAELDQAQSPEQLSQRLNEIKTHYENWKRTVLPEMPQGSQSYSNPDEEAAYQEYKAQKNGGKR
mgnify:CR=1 FL=1